MQYVLHIYRSACMIYLYQLIKYAYIGIYILIVCLYKLLIALIITLVYAPTYSLSIYLQYVCVINFTTYLYTSLP